MTNARSRNTPRGKTEKKRTRPRIAPGVRVEIERMLKAGASNNEIGTRYGVAEGSVRYIRGLMKADVADAVEPSPVQPELTQADAGIPDDASPEAALAQVNLMISDLTKMAGEAREDRNYSAAARGSAEAAKLMPLKNRLRLAVEQGSGDAVTIPRDLIDSKIEKIYARMRTLASVEMCPRCGCELRMAAVGAARETNKETK